jgi:hypothetical protein
MGAYFVMYSQNCLVPPATDVYFEAQFVLLSCFCELCSFYTLRAITHTDSQYCCQELAPGIQSVVIYRNMMACELLNMNMQQYCIQVCIFKYENK